jgi:FixJ family two-component response regulator
LESVGIDPVCFASTREFNDAALPDRPGCLILDLGIGEITVKLHRSNAKRKMQAASARDLVRAWEAVPPALREQRRPGLGSGAFETGWSERAGGLQGGAAAA